MRFVPGMCFSIWKSAWVVFRCVNFVRLQFSVKIFVHFPILPAWGSDRILSVVSD